MARRQPQPARAVQVQQGRTVARGHITDPEPIGLDMAFTKSLSRLRHDRDFLFLRKSAASNLADMGQYLVPEQFERAQQRLETAGAGNLEHQVENAGPAFRAAPADLVDHPIGAADKVGRQNPADIGGSRLAGNIAPVELQQRIAHAVAQRECLARLALGGEHPLRFGVGLTDQDIGAVDDMLGLRLPTPFGALLAIVANSLGDDIERRVGDAEAEMMARREFAGFAAGAEGLGRRVRLLARPRPYRNRAKAKMAALPAKRLRFGPGLE